LGALSRLKGKKTFVRYLNNGGGHPPMGSESVEGSRDAAAPLITAGGLSKKTCEKRPE
jgi:hypothetical protein